MPKIKVLPHATVCPQGAEIEGVVGKSICDNLLDNHIDIEHACEKQAACTTCHVILRQGFDSLEPAEANPDVDPKQVRFTDLYHWVLALPGFADDPKRCGEKILEAIQLAWIDEAD